MASIYHIAPKRSGHVFVGNMIKSWCPDSRYYELENKAPRKNEEGKIAVLQTRDLLNWLASYTNNKTLKQYNTRPIRAWYAITRAIWPDNFNAVKIYYDRFVVDQEYRKSICNQLGGTYNEDLLLQVVDNGDGSSFDGIEFDGKADKMQVLTRYKQVDPRLYFYFFKRYPHYLKFYYRLCEDQEKIVFLEGLGL